MIPIKYKGKGKAPQGMTGNWVTGFYCEVGGEWFIIPEITPMTDNGRGDVLPREDMVEIECDSARLSTGLQDMSGKDVYRGDMLEDKDGNRYVVRWMDVSARFVVHPLNLDNQLRWLSAEAIPLMVIIGEIG